MSGTIRAEEVRKFDALAGRWWDPAGPMAPLHAMNPLRIGWIARQLGDPAGLSVLDVGCGAGLAAEAMARLGARVTGIDAAPEALDAARSHAANAQLAITYREAAPEALAAEGARFDAVMALEVVEHVADRAAFVAALATLVRPGGKVFLSTLNRTPRAWLTAKLGAEYLLRWLPRGTHDWKMFVTPAELGADCRAAGLRVTALAGMAPGPRGWRETRDVGVNYILAAERA
jgi:2-polyprenyl-6-hydroxyphenyl methylase/3-demethylubiquinone-9 3-methyltransferase